jgi:hypothetical protein
VFEITIKVNYKKLLLTCQSFWPLMYEYDKCPFHDPNIIFYKNTLNILKAAKLFVGPQKKT